jgi:ArsR family transcriptional regulator
LGLAGRGIFLQTGLDRANQIDLLQQIAVLQKSAGTAKKIWKRNDLLDSAPYIHKSGYMESEAAILALAALAQPTRLDVFKLLVKHEPEGLAAGDIARALSVPQNTMSSHLSILSHAGLVSAQRFGRSIVYRGDLARLQAVMLFMLKDCCGGRPEICAPLTAALNPCCPSEEMSDV